MSRLLMLAAALSVLAAPASVLAAPASVLAAPAAQTQPACYYNTVLLKNVSPAAVLTALHWDARNSVLPQGVRRIYALQSRHCLLVEATPVGYAQVKALAAPLDAAAASSRK